MNWIAVFGALPMIFSLTKQLVEDFEIPGVTGDRKKQAVMDLLKAALDTTTSMGIQAPVSIVLTLASSMIDAIVAAYNLIGKFSKKAAAQTAS